MVRNTKAIKEGSQMTAAESSRNMAEQDDGTWKKSDEDEGHWLHDGTRSLITWWTTTRHMEEARKNGNIDVEKMVANFHKPWMLNDIDCEKWRLLCSDLNLFWILVCFSLSFFWF